MAPWPDGWRGLLMKTGAMGIQEPERVRWPGHLPVGALRVVRWSAHYDQTVPSTGRCIGLPVLETFRDSYGLDGTILGPAGRRVHLEIVRPGRRRTRRCGLDQLVFYLPDAAAREQIRPGSPPRVPARLPRSVTGRTTAVSPTRTRTGGKSCSHPGSTARRESANLTWPTWWTHDGRCGPTLD